MSEEDVNDAVDERPDDGAAPVPFPQHENRPVSGGPIETDTPDEADDTRRLPFNVVGLGASAGGIEALIELFEHLPADTAMAYVVVLHLSADQKSHLSEILARHTPMPVAEIESGRRVEPDHVYVIPPKAVVRLDGGVFVLEEPDPNSPQRSIDTFFYSLASDQKSRAIGVVFSGMDGDGALGLRSIKGEGGITMVQAPESARYPAMPRSSISADHVDIVSTPAALAAHLSQIARQFRESNVRLLQDGAPAAGEDQYLGRILSLLRNVSGVDFRLYKPSTIRRRIVRRMLLHRMDSLADYHQFLVTNSGEVRALHEDALINVTRFFRDPDVFDAFKGLVLPQVFDGGDRSQVRMWVAGCSTGEEVYSLAICLLEYLTGSVSEPAIQIFGTDASESNIQKSRAGLYPASIAADVSTERLRRFFDRTEKGYQVIKRVRDMCIFARQNLCHDPPFSRMDVISCRNVLIYFGADLQRQLISTFHYALRPDGFLILGTSETIREFTDLFALSDRKHKIYLRNGNSASSTGLDGVPRTVLPDLVASKETARTEAWGDMELQRAADRIVLARYAPPGVVVNERMEVIQTRGRTSPFIQLRPGTATFHLLRMTPDSIAAQVSAAVRRAIEEDVPVQVEGLQVREGETTRDATLEVLPIQSVGQRARCYLIVFVPTRPHPDREPLRLELSPTLSAEEKDRLIVQMRHDLSSTRLYLQSLLEERDAKNQELVSANEEIQSANEELQSTNEELETTKEELQSANEELHTVNDELQARNVVLTQASNDLMNLLNSVNLPVLMLSNGLTIRHFTPPTQRVMKIRSSDVGRPFADLRVNLNIDDLTPLFTEVLDTLVSREIEVQDREGHWYLLRVRPYRTTDNKIEGLVVALFDIDQLRRVQQELRSARDFSRSVIQGVPLPLAVVDFDFNIRATNQAFCAIAQVETGELDRRYLPDLTASRWGLDRQLRENLDELRNAHNVGDSFEFEHVTPGDNSRTFSIRGCVLQPDEEQFLLVTVEDLTAHREAERVLKTERDRLTSEVEARNEALGRSQEELRALTANLFASQEEERRRIARELHDDIGQRLGAIEMESDQVWNRLPAEAGAARESIERIRARAAELSEDVRLMSHRLHPSVIEDLGLRPALQSLAEEFGRREDMIVTFSTRNVPESLPLDVATALYRIAQEALRNVSKHAGQTHTRVTLTGTPDAVRLQVADFGQGFDVESERHGLGLLSMEERARHLGGEVVVQSALGEGTKITVTVPLPRG